MSPRSASLLSGKPLLWALLALPAAVTLYDYASGAALADELLHPTGEWSARLLVVALALTPLSILFQRSAALRWLLARRRAFGVAAFGYAALHLLFYVLDMGGVPPMLGEVALPGIWTGWAALALLLPLALTSSDSAMRALKRGWKRLQRLAYPAAILTFAHWVTVHNGWRGALLWFGPLAALQLVRIFRLIPSQQNPKENIA